MNDRLVAVVPVRKGSQRVLSKNTRAFADTSLIELKLRVLKEVDGIDEIVVNTDCEDSIAVARQFGCTIHERDPMYASSDVTNDQHWRHLAEVTDTDIFMMAQTTSPLVKVSTYEHAIKMFRSGAGEIDSVNSVSSEKKFLWKDGRPLNYDPARTPKSQDLPDIVSLNFAVTLIDRSVMLERANVVGKRPSFLELDRIESLDVDEPIDFEFAEFVYKKIGIEGLLK